MASPNLRSKAGESSADEGEPIDGAAEGWAQLGVKVKLRDSAHIITFVKQLRRLTGIATVLTDADANSLEDGVGEYRGIPL